MTTPTATTPTEPLLPVSVLTGFLGSGKTTLLNHLLNDSGMKDVLVLINEFGEIGLDHQLIASVDAEMVVLASGCLCCTIQSDLSKTLREMALKRVRGEVPPFRRVVIETTGLADPAPILHTLMQDPLVAAYYRLDGVVTCVDAVNGDRTLDAQIEAVKQAAVADRLVITKTDVADSAAVTHLEARLAGLNPGALKLYAAQGGISPDRLFDAGLYNPETKSLDVRRWLQAEAYDHHDDDHHHNHAHDEDHDHHDHEHRHHHHHGDDVNRHDHRIQALCLTVDQPIEWDNFALWAQTLTSHRGDDMLRLKAILNVAGQDRPVVVHGVQHLFHPPVLLPAWPDDDRRSRVVMIVRDIPQAALEASLRTCLDTGEVSIPDKTPEKGLAA
ncbi:MAG: CobW family GTP-binding protein [Elsteraceae bacterium]